MEYEQRQELRIEQKQTVFIEVRHRYVSEGKSQSRLLICRSVDLSANGIRAIIDEELPVDAIYQLAVEFADSKETLCLAAQVKWIKTANNGDGFEVGLMILDSDDTDVEAWKLHIAQQLSK